MTGPRRPLLCAVVLATFAGACQMHGGAAAPRVPVRVPCPELRWAAFPSEADLARDKQGRLGAAERVSYQLRVFETSRCEMVYQQFGLTEPQHRPALSLDPSRRYVWTVRPVFWLDGRRRIGDWRGKHEPRSGVSETVRATQVPLPLDLFPRIVLEPAGDGARP
jgi:hypothetical protein